MQDSTVILDPTDEREPIQRPLAARPGAFAGPLGIIDISKPRGGRLLRRARAPAGRPAARRRDRAPAQADLHQAGAARPARGSGGTLQRRDPGARRLRVVHVVQCARPGRLRGAGHPDRDGGVVGIRRRGRAAVHGARDAGRGEPRGLRSPPDPGCHRRRDAREGTRRARRDPGRGHPLEPGGRRSRSAAARHLHRRHTNRSCQAPSSWNAMTTSRCCA